MSDLRDLVDDGLPDLLEGRRPPGVLRWHSLAAPTAVRDVTEAAGWRWAHVAGWPVTARGAWFAAARAALDLPAWFGHNLDALVDALGDLPGPTLLVWEHWARLARPEPEAFASLVEVLAARSDRPVTDHRPPFAVLLWGEGPATGTRSLD